MAYQDFLLDKRIVQRHLDKGIVDAKQMEKSIAALPDRAANIAPVDEVVSDDDDDDDAED
jgi:hypothetical protein